MSDSGDEWKPEIEGSDSSEDELDRRELEYEEVEEISRDEEDEEADDDSVVPPRSRASKTLKAPKSSKRTPSLSRTRQSETSANGESIASLSAIVIPRNLGKAHAPKTRLPKSTLLSPFVLCASF